jgi:hypothetical protein
MSTVVRSPAVVDGPGSHSAGLSHEVLWDWIGAASLAVLLTCFAISEQLISIGSEKGRWIYSHVGDFRPEFLFVAAAAAAVVGVFLFFTRSVAKADLALLLVWLAVGLAVQVLIRSVAPFSLDRIFASDTATSFYSVTKQFSAASALRDFERLRPSWPLHAQSNMPGKLMLVYALENVSQSPAGLAWLVVLVSNAGAVLMYAFVRELFADRRMALHATVLYLLVPAKLYFVPILNTVTPVGVLACAVLLIKWLRTGSATWAAALGVGIFALAFFEPLPLVMGLPFAVLVIILRGTTWPRILSQVAVGLIAFLFAYESMKILTGFDLVRTFRQLGREAVQFNEVAGRPYGVWVVANIREFLFGIGVCQAIVFPAAMLDGIRRSPTWRDAATRPIVALGSGILLVLAVIDATGLNRGEVIRLWIFLACFFQIPAAYVCSRLESRLALWVISTVTILQGTIGLAMIGFVGP